MIHNIQTQRDCLGLYTPTGRGEEEQVWAEGRTIWDYEPRVPDWKTKDPAEMTLAELVATQNQELPSTSKITWSLGLDGTLSIDRPSSTDDDDDAQNVIEAEAAYEGWAAERASEHLGMTPYTEFPPDLANRIQWERQRFYSSDPVKMRLQGGAAGPRVQIIGLKLDPEQYAKVAKAYLKRLLAKGFTTDDITNMARIEKTRDRIAQIRDQVLMEMPEAWYEAIYLDLYSLDHHPNRDDFLDLDLHGGHEEWVELDEEEEAMIDLGVKIDREIVIRGARKATYTLDPIARERALWHGTIGEQHEIGHHWTREDNFDNEDEVPTPSSLDPFGLKALGVLRD